MRKLSVLLFLLVPSFLFAQGVRIGSDVGPITTVQSPGGVLYSVSGATISICSSPANGVPCTNKATTYTDGTLVIPCPTSTQVVLAGTSSCVRTADSYGQWGVWLGAGNYAYTVTLPSGASLGPYSITAANGSGSGGVSAVNGISGSIALVGGSGVTISPTGQNITISAPAASSPAFSAIASGVNSSATMTVGSGASLGANGSGSITATSGTLTGNISTKPASGSAIRYASYDGNDSNDGLSPGSAKQTIFAALEALPGGSASPPTAGAGQIFALDGGAANCGKSAQMNPVAGAGIWILGSSDPNSSSPPSGWLHQGPGFITITGLAGNGAPSGSDGMQTCINFSSGGDANPWLWLSNVNGFTIQNINPIQSQQPIRIGCDSNDSCATNASGSTGIHFINVSSAVDNNNAAYGPTVFIGPNSYWIWFDHFTPTANYNATPGTDAAANMVINATSNGSVSAAFDITIQNSVWQGCGGVKYYTQNHFATIKITDVHTECNTAGGNGPTLWFPAPVSEFLNVYLDSIDLPDYTPSTPVIQNDATGPIAIGSSIVANSICGNLVDAVGPGISGMGWCHSAGNPPQLSPVDMPLPSAGPPYTPASIASVWSNAYLALSTVAADSFTRANAATIGANWADGSGFSIASNSATAASQAFSFWNGQVFSGDQFSQVTVGATPVSSGLVGVTVRNSSSGASPGNDYFWKCGPSSTATFGKYTAGTPSGLGSTTYSEACTTNAVLRIEAVGSQITIYYNGALVDSVSDSSFTGGEPGIMVDSNTAGSATTWSGGNLTPGFNQIGYWNQTQAFGAHVNQASAKTWAGTCTLGTNCNITFGTAYVSAPACVGTDTTAIDAVKAAITNSGVTFTGNSTDVLAWACFGNPN